MLIQPSNEITISTLLMSVSEGLTKRILITVVIIVGSLLIVLYIVDTQLGIKIISGTGKVWQDHYQVDVVFKH
jgi:hypothetical protein